MTYCTCSTLQNELITRRDSKLWNTSIFVIAIYVVTPQRLLLPDNFRTIRKYESSEWQERFPASFASILQLDIFHRNRIHSV
jgi:hypothetical protein